MIAYNKKDVDWLSYGPKGDIFEWNPVDYEEIGVFVFSQFSQSYALVFHYQLYVNWIDHFSEVNFGSPSKKSLETLQTINDIKKMKLIVDANEFILTTRKDNSSWAFVSVECPTISLTIIRSKDDSLNSFNMFNFGKLCCTLKDALQCLESKKDIAHRYYQLYNLLKLFDQY